MESPYLRVSNLRLEILVLFIDKKRRKIKVNAGSADIIRLSGLRRNQHCRLMNR